MSLIVVTGLAAEARIAAAPDVQTIIGAGRSARLAADIEAAIAGGARRLLSFGVAGALSPQLRAGDLVVAHGVTYGAWRLSCDLTWRAAISRRLQGLSTDPDQIRQVPGMAGEKGESLPAGLYRYGRNGGWRPIAGSARSFSPAEIAGVDAPLADVRGKRDLLEATDSVAVDMESAIAAQAARRHVLPFAIVRVIADPAQRPLPAAALCAMREDGEIDTTAVVGALARNPCQLPGLIRLAVDSRNAFSALVRVRALLGADFASANL